MIMVDILNKIDKITSKFLYKETITEEWVDCQLGERDAVGTKRPVQYHRSYNVIDGMFAISKSLDNVAKAINDMNPRNQSSHAPSGRDW